MTVLYIVVSEYDILGPLKMRNKQSYVTFQLMVQKTAPFYFATQQQVTNNS